MLGMVTTVQANQRDVLHERLGQGRGGYHRTFKPPRKHNSQPRLSTTQGILLLRARPAVRHPVSTAASKEDSRRKWVRISQLGKRQPQWRLSYCTFCDLHYQLSHDELEPVITEGIETIPMAKPRGKITSLIRNHASSRAELGYFATESEIVMRWIAMYPWL